MSYNSSFSHHRNPSQFSSNEEWGHLYHAGSHQKMVRFTLSMAEELGFSFPLVILVVSAIKQFLLKKSANTTFAASRKCSHITEGTDRHFEQQWIMFSDNNVKVQGWIVLKGSVSHISYWVLLRSFNHHCRLRVSSLFIIKVICSISQYFNFFLTLFLSCRNTSVYEHTLVQFKTNTIT